MDLYGRLLQRVLFPAWEGVRQRPTQELGRFLDASQWWSEAELTALQGGLLRRLVRHAYRHTAHYRQILDERGLAPESIGHPADLAKLPLLDRGTARASLETRLADAPPRVTVKKASSGTTGEPMVVMYNAESRHWRDATRWRGYGWGGYQIGMRALHYWGFGAASPKSWWAGKKVEWDRRLKRDLYLDCTPRGDDYLAGIVDEIRRYRPQVIVTYTQAGAALARYVTRTGKRDWDEIPVLVGAERLWPHDREAIEAAFGPKVFETYGCREFMLIGSECEEHDGLHQSMETMIVELLVKSGDGSWRAARPGEVGEVVITDLHNLAAPMIRYVTGDLATMRAAEPCRCGRNLTRIGPIEGRVTETLRDGRGEPVSGLIFSILFVPLAEVTAQFQAVQHKDGSITLRLLPIDRAAFSVEQVRPMLDQFATTYLPGVAVRIEVVDDIPPTKSGKRQIVLVER